MSPYLCGVLVYVFISIMCFQSNIHIFIIPRVSVVDFICTLLQLKCTATSLGHRAQEEGWSCG